MRPVSNKKAREIQKEIREAEYAVIFTIKNGKGSVMEVTSAETEIEAKASLEAFISLLAQVKNSKTPVGLALNLYAEKE